MEASGRVIPSTDGSQARKTEKERWQLCCI